MNLLNSDFWQLFLLQKLQQVVINSKIPHSGKGDYPLKTAFYLRAARLAARGPGSGYPARVLAGIGGPGHLDAARRLPRRLYAGPGHEPPHLPAARHHQGGGDGRGGGGLELAPHQGRDGRLHLADSHQPARVPATSDILFAFFEKNVFFHFLVFCPTLQWRY